MSKWSTLLWTAEKALKHLGEQKMLEIKQLTVTEATATIVRGFLRVDIEGLPQMLSAELQRTIEASEKELM